MDRVPGRLRSSGGRPRPVLRPLDTGDLDDLLRVQAAGSVAALGHLFPQDRYPFPVDAVRARWVQELADPGTDCFAVLGEDDLLAGFAATRGDELLHVGTSLDTWGTGLAGLAHDEVLGHLASQGHVSAWLRVFEANERARRFYVRRGWAPTGERSESTFAPYPVLVHHRRDLGAGV